MGLEFLLEKFLNDYNSDSNETTYDLHALEQVTVEHMFSRNEQVLKEIRNNIDSLVYDKKYSDSSDYILGKAHTLIELINFYIDGLEFDKIIKDISAQTVQLRMLKYIASELEVNPAQISAALDISRQQVSNYLKQLRSRELVNAVSIGKHRWYSLTLHGRRVLNSSGDLILREQEKELDYYNVSATRNFLFPNYENPAINFDVERGKLSGNDTKRRSQVFK